MPYKLALYERPTGKELYALPAPLQHDCPKCFALAGQTCVTKTGNPAAEMHAGRSKQLCNAHFIKQVHHHPGLNCANLENHRGRHRNAVNNLQWHQDFQVDLDNEHIAELDD